MHQVFVTKSQRGEVQRFFLLHCYYSRDIELQNVTCQTPIDSHLGETWPSSVTYIYQVIKQEHVTCDVYSQFLKINKYNLSVTNTNIRHNKVSL